MILDLIIDFEGKSLWLMSFQYELQKPPHEKFLFRNSSHKLQYKQSRSEMLLLQNTLGI